MTSMEAQYESDLERIKERGERFAKFVQRDADDRYDEEYSPMSWGDYVGALCEIPGIDGAEIIEAIRRMDYIQAGAMSAVAAQFYWKRQCLIDAERALDKADEEARQEYMVERCEERVRDRNGERIIGRVA